MTELSTLCDRCEERINDEIVAWGRELNEEERKFNKQLSNNGKTEKCMAFNRFFNKSFHKRKRNCEEFVPSD